MTKHGDDTQGNTTAGRRNRSDRVTSIIVVFATILVLGTAAAAWAAVTLIGSDDLEPLKATVEAVAAESSVVTDEFLEEAESVGGLVSRVLDANPDLENGELMRLMQLLHTENASIDGIFVGNGDGSFIYATKGLATEADGLRIKTISNADPTARSAFEMQLDERHDQIARIELPDDTYDPRTRPWYSAAEDAGAGWTDPYVFDSSGQPGITYFRRHESFDENGIVLGVDMRLTDVTEFLSARQPGTHGVAAMVSPAGAVISGMNSFDGSSFEPPTTLAAGETSQAIVSQIEDSSEQKVSAYSTVGGGDEAWTLVVSAVESDFGGRLSGQADRIRTIIAIVALALGLMVLLSASVALARVRQLREKATIDDETGLATRAETHAVVEELLGSDQRILVLNAAVGHRDLASNIEADNSVLPEAGAHLHEFATPNGIAGRTGNREFLAARPLDPGERPIDLVSQLYRALRQFEQSTTDVTADDDELRIGWEVVDPAERTRSLDSVLRSLDLALLTAESGPRPFVEYTDALQPPIVADERLRREFNESIRAGAFVTHFQPEIDLRTGEVVGAEALLRRQRPDGGLETAEPFISDLERLGMLSDLTHHILDQTVDFATRWGALSSFTIRINLAASELNDSTVMARLSGLTDVSAHRWCIELTERTIESLDARAVAHLHDLVSSGIDIALDDFGTGYSSMAELKRLPITTLKIDRTFVEPLSEDHNEPVSIAALIQSVASRLGLDLVAEGIETDTQRLALVELGCQRGQGWLMAPALPANEFVTWAQTQASVTSAI